MILDSYEYIPTAYVKVFYLPTNAHMVVLKKKILKFTLK